MYLTIGGTDEGEAGDNPEEGHVDDDGEVLKGRAAVLSLDSAGSQPIRALVNLSSSAVSCLSDLRPQECSQESTPAL